jgi:hypothetical protein
MEGALLQVRQKVQWIYLSINYKLKVEVEVEVEVEPIFSFQKTK